jgi:hypothetical protein
MRPAVNQWWVEAAGNLGGFMGKLLGEHRRKLFWHKDLCFMPCPPLRGTFSPFPAGFFHAPVWRNLFNHKRLLIYTAVVPTALAPALSV